MVRASSFGRNWIRRCFIHVALLSLCSFFVATAKADSLPEQFTLSHYVPGDAWLYLHTVHNPDLDWLDKEWAEVYDAFEASGVGPEVAGMLGSLFSSLDEEKATEAKASFDKLTKLFKDVQWGKLASREFVYSQRVAKVLGGYDYFIMMRGDSGSGKANMDAMVALISEYTDSRDKVSFEHKQQYGIDSWSLRSHDKDAKVKIADLDLFHKGDVIGLTSGAAALEEVLALVAGKGKVPPIAASPRFRQALAQVEAPEGYVSFVDVKRLLADLKSTAVPCCKKEKSADCAYCANRAAFRRAIGILDVADYSITTVNTDGRRRRSVEVLQLQPEKAKCAVACCGFARKPFERFDQYVPANALAFSLNGTFDLQAAYELLIEFLAKDLPGGEDLVAKWNGALAAIGFDPHRDLFSWLSGETISVTLPPAVVTPMSGADRVVMIRVKDAKIAQEKIDVFLETLQGVAQAQGQTLMVTPADVHAEGFKQIMHPMFAMIMRPVIGVHEEWLVMSTSNAAINRCLDVASGKAPSIVENARFEREGLRPSGAVRAASFTNTSRFGEELGGAAAMTGMIGGMGSAMLQGEQLTHARTVLQKLTQLVAKLGPVVSKLDFYSSESSVTTYDSNGTMRTERVVTYKSGPPPKNKSTDAR